jgi:hypothetical protein
VGYFGPGHSSELRNRWPRKGGGRGLKRASPATIGRDVNSSRTRATTRHSACTSNQEIYERLSPSDLKQAAVVEATFLYNAAMRDQMLPRKPLPTPEKADQESQPLKGLYPGAVEEPKNK